MAVCPTPSPSSPLPTDSAASPATVPTPRVMAVVVTYNRCTLLRRNLACLCLNKPLERIFVINNGSTDNTGEWLDTMVTREPRLTVVTQDNVGGSGGFYRGISLAYEAGADWIWCMDDDVFPHPDCLTRLLSAATPDTGILAPRRLLDGTIYTNDFRAYNLTNPFASMYVGRLSKDKQPVDTPTDIAGTAFEGPLIRRDVVSRIGLPNRNLFIFCDDTDYCLRTIRAGYRIRYIPTALMDKHRFFAPRERWDVRNEKKKWKRFYQVRNATYLNHHYGDTLGVRYLRGLIGVSGYLVTALLTTPFSRAWQWRDIPRLWQAYRDGIREKLGRME